jgi:hypothetical protein
VISRHLRACGDLPADMRVIWPTISSSDLLDLMACTVVEGLRLPLTVVARDRASRNRDDIFHPLAESRALQAA